MNDQDLLISEVGVISDYLELLARRRARGEITTLYPEVRDAADTVMYLRHDAPGYLQPELAHLQARCNMIMRSIAH
jgi:hypothetical protein